jgi:hypothetical protein
VSSMHGPFPMGPHSLSNFFLKAYPGVDMQGIHPRVNVSEQELINNHIHDFIVRLSVKFQINVDCFEPVF